MRRTLSSVLAAAAVLAAGCADHALPTAAPSGPARIVNGTDAGAGAATRLAARGAPGLCLDVWEASQEPATPTAVYTCHGGANQQFTLPAPGTTGEVRAYGTLCLDAYTAQGNDGDPIVVYPCHGGANQQWTLTADGELRGIAGKCVDVAGAGTAPGTRVILWTCHGGANQRWDADAEAPAVFVGAGDIAGCTWTGDEATAALLDTIPGTVWAAGDLAYPNGTAEEFANCYQPSWGRHKARTRPAPGNHEYNTPGAAPYYAYFGEAAAGPAGRGYYSYDVGRWHVVALNSNVDVAAASAQAAWLRADLAANPRACTLAYWHHPRFSSGGSSTRYQALWQALYDAGAEVVLVGHIHNYERFAPQTPDGTADPARGVREFVVGTGGAGLTRTVPSQLPNSEFLDGAHQGVLKLELGAASYRWTFISTDGVARDAGEADCH